MKGGDVKNIMEGERELWTYLGFIERKLLK